MEDGKSWSTDKTEHRKEIKEATSKGWLQVRMQSREGEKERDSVFREVQLSLKWLNLWGENRKDKSKSRREF